MDNRQEFYSRQVESLSAMIQRLKRKGHRAAASPHRGGSACGRCRSGIHRNIRTYYAGLNIRNQK